MSASLVALEPLPSAGVPSDRIAALHRYEILDSEPEARYDDLTQLASRVCRMPVALMSLVDESRAWFKSKVGLDAPEIPRDLAPCVYAIETRRVFHVEDMQLDPRFASNPLVKGGMVRSYAGAPMITPDGHVLGTLCVIDSQPRALPPDEVALLESLARQAVAQLELSVKLREAKVSLLETQHLQVQLVSSERLAAMGTLTASVGHELNNPLVYVGANLELLEEEFTALRGSLPDERLDTLHDMVRGASEGIEHIRRVVHGLSAFSRADSQRREAVDPTQSLSLSIDMAAHQIHHCATLVRDIATLPLVNADHGRLGQVFLNLLVNAAQAIPAGAARAHEISVRAHTSPTGDAIIAVSDDGMGIPPEYLSRIFEPFFTTKGIGSGTGLGLSVCHGIVTALGGTITVDSTVGRGTTFTVTLPAAERIVAAPPAHAVVAAAAPRHRILIVDDNQRVGESIARLLRRHATTVANSGEQALSLLRGGMTVDVVLCDLMMPQMTGIEFQRVLENEFPALVHRMAFLTGGAFTSEVRDFLETTPTPVLEKPFPTGQIEALVQRLAAMSRATN